jgi:carbon-monoxide dehydrogenase medium subunit
MKPAPFEFIAPADLGGVLQALAQHGEDGRILAGGQSLVPLLNLRLAQPRVLISINSCADLDYIRREGDRLVIGARVRQARALESADVHACCPLLAAALPHLGGMANRNRGTICGSLAHADPLAELPAVAVALDAQFTLASGKGRRRVAARDFFVDQLTTCIEPGEMLEQVSFPCAANGTRAVFLEVANRGHGFAVAGVGAQLRLDNTGLCAEIRLAAIGGGSIARRLINAEKVLAGRAPISTAIADAAAAASQEVDPSSDIHADADYRREVIGVLVGRAMTQLVQNSHAVVRS